MNHRTRILLVDDDERVRFVLGGALQRLGAEYAIVTAGDGREALDIAEETEFDLLITDLRLPRTDGLALTSAFAKLSPATKVIWITAYGCHRFSDATERLNVMRCLDKPVEIQELRDAVIHVLRTTSPSVGHNGDGDGADAGARGS